jgi:hypothetical protein
MRGPCEHFKHPLKFFSPVACVPRWRTDNALTWHLFKYSIPVLNHVISERKFAHGPRHSRTTQNYLTLGPAASLQLLLTSCMPVMSISARNSIKGPTFIMAVQWKKKQEKTMLIKTRRNGGRLLVVAIEPADNKGLTGLRDLLSTT